MDTRQSEDGEYALLKYIIVLTSADHLPPGGWNSLCKADRTLRKSGSRRFSPVNTDEATKALAAPRTVVQDAHAGELIVTSASHNHQRVREQSDGESTGQRGEVGYRPVKIATLMMAMARTTCHLHTRVTQMVQ